MGDDLPFLEFDPIALTTLESDAALLVRHDNKYVVDTSCIERLAPALVNDFHVLEIDGKRGFLYHTRYFDDPSLSIFHDHRQNRRRRFKVRTRHYRDVDRCFLEVKIKSLRGMTLKRRQPVPVDRVGRIDREALAFVMAELAREGRFRVPGPLGETLFASCYRTTLVSRNRVERVTLDRGLTFVADGNEYTAPRACWIVEVKSMNGRGEADHALRRLGQRPIEPCSKYCLGLVLTGKTGCANRFLPAVRRITGVMSGDRFRGASAPLPDTSVSP